MLNKWQFLFPVKTLPEIIKVVGCIFWNSRFCQTQARQQDDHKFLLYTEFLRESVSVTIENPAFCLALCLTGVRFRGKLQHVVAVSQQKFQYRPIRTRKIGGIRLSEALCVG